MLKTYYVRYIDFVEEGELAFKCMAEDESHAREQCQNAYAGCTIISVAEFWI